MFFVESTQLHYYRNKQFLFDLSYSNNQKKKMSNTMKKTNLEKAKPLIYFIHNMNDG